jgi:hypothetical protein
MIRHFVLVSSLAVLAMPAQAQVRGWFPKAEGECGWVHGRFAIYNGHSVARIWVIGTSHILAHYAEDGDESFPTELDARNWAKGRDDLLTKAVYSDFYVCATERHRPGRMQHVKIKRVKNAIVANRQL